MADFQLGFPGLDDIWGGVRMVRESVLRQVAPVRAWREDQAQWPDPDASAARIECYAGQYDGTGGAGGAPQTGGDGAEGGPPVGPNERPREEVEAEATARMERLNALPPEQQAEAVKNLSPQAFESLLNDVPFERREELAGLVAQTTDVKRKLELWSAYHQSRHANEAARALEAAGGDPAYAKALERATDGTFDESNDEVRELLAKGVDNVTPEMIDAMMARKEKELQIEIKYGVNLTNDRQSTIAKMDQEADRNNRKRRVWEDKELDLLDEELANVPPEQRWRVAEMRRASANWYDEKQADGTNKAVKDGPHALHHGDTIEYYDTVFGDPNRRDDDAEWTIVHEIGHETDENSEAAAKYREAAGFIKGEEAIRGHLESQCINPDEVLNQLKTAPKDDYGRHTLRVGDKVYTQDGAGNLKAYNANAMPVFGENEAERTLGWKDEHGYARTNDDDYFAEHYRIAARDPIRYYRDMVEKPQERIDALQREIDLRGDLDPNLDDLKAQLKDAQDQKNGLEKQYERMRSGVFGIDDKAIAADALAMQEQYGLTPEDAIRFQEQAKRCVTPVQLDKLKQAYATGLQVDEYLIEDKAATIPAGQEEAFKRDAANCFTQEQLDKLTDAYAKGLRAGQTWDPSKATNDTDLVLGY